MKKILRWIATKEKKLFEMLEEQSRNTSESAGELQKFIGGYSKFERSERKAMAQSIKKIEHKAGELTNAILHKLDKDFASTIDRECIRDVVILLNDIIGLMSAAALRFVVLSMERIDNYIIKQVEIISSIVAELNKAVLNLKKFKGSEEHFDRIHEQEKAADNVYHEALSELFHFYKNSIDIIKYKDVYELLESVIKKCGNSANAIKRISARYA